MKKLVMLITLLTWSFPSFSQTVTDTTSVILPEPIARQVIKDLILGDAAIKELDLTKSKLVLVEKKVTIQDSLITNLNLQIDNLKKADLERKNQLEISNDLSTRLQQDLFIEKQTAKFYKSTTGVLVICTVILSLAL